MKQFLKKFMLMAAVFAFVGMAAFGLSVRAEASERVADETKVLAQVVVPQEEVFAAVTFAAADGVVNGSGVRLRKEPKETATILELMNNGEYVDVDHTRSTAKWYYVKRLKTGTNGYASKQYIIAN